jgi:hypothetical protein
MRPRQCLRQSTSIMNLTRKANLVNEPAEDSECADSVVHIGPVKETEASEYIDMSGNLDDEIVDEAMDEIVPEFVTVIIDNHAANERASVLTAYKLMNLSTPRMNPSKRTNLSSHP